ncbi:recombinase family protein [Janthinobacterium sp. PLB04]|uniref:Recombinase family protein n=1 Tax=Janthinobacterium lividum TaxID=29581 RepID=A0AAJ4T651_9BURK|nr:MULTISPECIES: recombinase family protein [Janthinobacterium]KAB0331038.1 recombinase family protein [Janthinobacterium lividum]QSX97234.1 recombinase family protein [Janthinobacterium lividum]UGQ37158.1 recombinase family protein [Janthinobacterium sp. PLB04]
MRRKAAVHVPKALLTGAKPTAAVYVRMSTDNQNHSVSHQLHCISDYAERHGIDIIRTYADEGRSGLDFSSRPGLRCLIEDVQSGVAPFQSILAYDISRWGRFQDLDESAYYEYICRRAGVAIVYCAEDFENNGSSISSIIKSVKRAMAAEYSRELSSKVFAAQCRFVEMGFKQGGRAGFGLRRIPISASGKAKPALGFGERKSHPTDRVLLVPGPSDELEILRGVYDWYVLEKLSESEIAFLLNAMEAPRECGRAWTRDCVRDVLTNEKYIGNIIYNRASFKLRKRHIENPTSMWIQRIGVFPPLIPVTLFRKAQQERKRRLAPIPKEELLAMLRKLYEKHGKVTTTLIDQDDTLPGAQMFAYYFGTMLEAYTLAGLPPTNICKFIATRAVVSNVRAATHEQIKALIIGAGVGLEKGPSRNTFLLNGETLLKIAIARCLYEKTALPRWRVRMDEESRCDFVLAVLLDLQNQKADSYYLFPKADFLKVQITLTEANMSTLRQYKHASLDAMFGAGHKTTR